MRIFFTLIFSFFLPILTFSQNGDVITVDESTLYKSSFEFDALINTERADTLKSFPNPAHNELKIDVDSDEMAEYSIVAYNSLDEKCLEVKQITVKYILLNISNLRPDSYLFRVDKTDDQREYWGRFIKE